MPWLNMPAVNKKQDADDSSCFICAHAEMGWCKAHEREVCAFDNCSDFPVERKFELKPFWAKIEKENS